MRSAFSISYDLKGDDGDYTGLFEVLKSCPRWWHYLKSTWLVAADGDADQLWAKIEPHVKSGDRILVIGVTAQSQGFLPKKAWDWIERNVDLVPAKTP